MTCLRAELRSENTALTRRLDPLLAAPARSELPDLIAVLPLWRSAGDHRSGRKEKQFAKPIARLRLSKNWRDMGLLKRELRDIWLSDRNALFKLVVKDIEDQRKQQRRAATR